MEAKAVRFNRRAYLKLTRAIKPVKRFLWGTGTMMRIFEDICFAEEASDYLSLHEIRLSLTQMPCEEWLARTPKIKLLLNLCDYLLLTPANRQAALATRIRIFDSLSLAHELDRKVWTFIIRREMLPISSVVH